MTRPYGAAIFGCGAIGTGYSLDPKMKGLNTHAAAYNAHPGVELEAVCDVDPEKAESCAKQWSVSNFYTDPRSLLAKHRPEIVSICTPNQTHDELALMALESPGLRAIFVEKPLALSTDSARNIVNVAARKGIAVAVNYSRRFSPGFVELQKFLASGGIGQIQSFTGFYTKGILHNGTHWLDLARFLIGEIVSAKGFDLRREESYQGTHDGQVDALISCAVGGSVVQGYLCGLNANDFSLFEMDIIGTNGRVSIRDSGNNIVVSEVEDSPFYTGYKTLVEKRVFDGEMSDALFHAVENLIATLDGTSELKCSGHDGLQVLRIASELLKEARN